MKKYKEDGGRLRVNKLSVCHTSNLFNGHEIFPYLLCVTTDYILCFKLFVTQTFVCVTKSHKNKKRTRL